MHIPKNYFQDRLVLLLITLNTFLAVGSSLLVLFRLRSGNPEGFVGQYHANLGLSAFKPGSTSTFISFVAFAGIVLTLHVLLSMRMYHHRRHFAVAILWLALFLLLLLLIVGNALAGLQ